MNDDYDIDVTQIKNMMVQIEVSCKDARATLAELQAAMLGHGDAIEFIARRQSILELQAKRQEILATLKPAVNDLVDH